MMEVGRLCVKLSGRDAGMKCVVVDVLDKNLVLIDGQTRRRKCNISHLEPLQETIKIEKNTTHEKIVGEFKKLGIEIIEKKKKAKKTEKEEVKEDKTAKKPKKEVKNKK